MEKNYSVISNQFQGQTKTILICLTCGHMKEKYEPFMYLSLSIPSIGSVNIEDCLKKFCEVDTLQNSEKWMCKKCGCLVAATKQTQLIRLPRCLIIHLKRFKDIHRKINDYVHYTETLDLSSFVEGSEAEYKLYAKVKHMGSLHGGHYVAMAKQCEKWYCFNDNSVDITPFCASSDTYLLFYEKTGESYCNGNSVMKE